MQNHFDQYDNPADTVVKRVDPYKSEDQAFQRNSERRADEEHRRKMTEAAKKAEVEEENRKKALGIKTESQLQDIRAELSNVITTAKKAKELSKSGTFATGFGAETAGGIGGTAAKDVLGLLNTIGANTAFTRLQKMRDESPTGGALGQVTEKELALLRDSIASLDPSQSDGQFQGNMDNIIQHYQRILDKTGGGLSANVTDTGKTGTPGEKVEENGVMVGFYGADGNFVPIDSGPNFDAEGNPIPVEQLNQNAENEYAEQFKSGVGDVVQGAGDALGLVGNPLNAGINAIAGTELSTDLGQTFRDATGLPDISHPVAKAINRGGIAGLGFAGAAGAAKPIATGVSEAVASRVAANPALDALSGATSGASSEIAKQSGAGPVGQVTAGLVGGVGGFTGGNALSKFAQPKVASPLAQAAKRQGIDLLPADVGGATTRRISAAAAQGPLSASPVINAAQKSQSQIGQATKRITRNALPEDEAGELVRKGGDLFVKATSQRGSRLYERAGKAAKGVTIKPIGAIGVIDDNITQLSKLGGTNSTIINGLKTLRNDIADGLDVTGLRDARTSLGGAVFDGKIRSSKEQKLYGDVLSALSQDIEAGLRQAGKPDAANMFKSADNFWKQRVEQIDEVLQPIMGKGKSGEDVISSLEAMSRGKKGGVKRLSRLMAELPKNDAQSVRETLVSRLGNATAGQQDDIGSTFSASTFLTNWNRMSARGKAVMFQQGELRKNLDEIAKIANSTKQAQKFANSSQTGGVIGGALTGGNVVGLMIEPLTNSAALGGQFLTGRLMASPAFARWLAKIPKNMNPRAEKAYIDRLSVIAAREPVIANDIKSIQAFLNDSVKQSPASLAASEDKTDTRREPPK